MKKRGLNISFVRPSILIFAVASVLLPGNSSAKGAPAPVFSAEAKALLAERWDNAAVEKGLGLIANRNESADSRRAVLERFRNEARNLDPDTLVGLFNQTVVLAKDPTEDPQVSTSAIKTLENSGLLLEQSGRLSKEEVKGNARFLMERVRDRNDDLKLRGAAIRALGVLGVGDASGLLRELLVDPVESGKPEIAQNSLLTLVRLDGENAADPISGILGRTQNPAIFGTAAFSMGQIKTNESMVELVRNEDRFPDSALPDAALVGMEDVILSALDNPQDANLSYAIQGTRHLWKKGMRERYAPKLLGLLTAASLPLRKEVLDRLLEVAGTLSLDDEKQELRKIIPLVSNQSEFKEYSDRIESRLSAVVLTPTTTLATPKNLRDIR